MKHEKSCGALTFRTENGARRVLVIRHRHGGHWAFPKGHVEPGETERETLEETGVRVRFADGFRETTRYSPARGVEKTWCTSWLSTTAASCARSRRRCPRRASPRRMRRWLS